jgi:hypothetical protein
MVEAGHARDNGFDGSTAEGVRKTYNCTESFRRYTGIKLLVVCGRGKFSVLIHALALQAVRTIRNHSESMMDSWIREYIPKLIVPLSLLL